MTNNTNKSRKLTHRQPVTYFLTLLAGVAVASLGGCTIPTARQSQTEQPPQTESPQTEQSPLPPVASPTNQGGAVLPNVAGPDFVAEVVQKVGPAVVRINAVKIQTTQIPEAFEDPRLRRFFGVPNAQPRERVVRGIGSGFIITANGQIVTNAHVVNGADRVSVTLKDSRTFEGKVLGQDPVTDVAVIQIQANNLPIVAIGNSQAIQPGESAIAIGNPLGLDNTVTAGIISAINRSSSEVGVPAERVGFIQTDTAINPGNSGGPLLNARGQVIGMNTAIIQGAQGLGFAIPINTVQNIAQQLITKGEVQHPYMGVQMVTLTPEIKQQLEIQSDGRIRIAADRGVLIARVVPGSPSAEAGLRAGDVIQSINNQPVNTDDEIARIVERNSVGSQLQLQVQRGGKSAQVAVRLENLPVQKENQG